MLKFISKAKHKRHLRPHKSRKPHRQLFHLLVNEFLEKHRQCEVALDLACGSMYYAELLPARHYIGVDIDQEKLHNGKANYPDATAILSRVEEMAQDLSGDIVLCLQCIGINKNFKDRQTLEFVNRMIGATRIGGDLVLNVGPNAYEHFEAIDSELLSRFTVCRRVDYGRFHQPKTYFIAHVMAQLMRKSPKLAQSSTRPMRLYFCEGRRV